LYIPATINLPLIDVTIDLEGSFPIAAKYAVLPYVISMVGIKKPKGAQLLCKCAGKPQ
jgi:hypothetical protein